ncbi:putative polyketide synthase 19 [Bienertia sinuspersici]
MIEGSIEAPKIKKHRGPIKKTGIHARTLEERTPIILNCYGQPIGPTQKDVEDLVLETVNLSWRGYKSKLKKMYLEAVKKSSNLDDLHGLVPEDELKGLISYWNTSPAKEQNKKNKRNREKLDDMHTIGPRSYVALRHKLKQEDPYKQEPPKAKVYKESRKRNPKKAYKTSYGNTKANMSPRQMELVVHHKLTRQMEFM